ncbi:DUF4395 domain-containing protein [Hydrogenimonas sp. SS33]|uniref:DUF4395 domain-containing protein n=1 Tax=Hydrogenimonas leucolamina TaxID=2954236 RepID=UPI00336C058A
MSSCPISNERVNERVARIVGALVFVFALLTIFRPQPLWLILLLADFTARSFYRPWSPFARLARPLAERLGEPQVVDAAPKIFAARIGLGMTAAALLAYATHHIELLRVVMAVMALCALLEALWSYCVGCKMYTFYRRIVRWK